MVDLQERKSDEWKNANSWDWNREAMEQDWLSNPFFWKFLKIEEVVKRTGRTLVWKQLGRSLPAPHLYVTIAERWCWQHCSGEDRNSEERQDETEPDGSGRGRALGGPSRCGRFGSGRGIPAMGHQPRGPCLSLILQLTWSTSVHGSY